MCELPRVPLFGMLRALGGVNGTSLLTASLIKQLRKLLNVILVISNS